MKDNYSRQPILVSVSALIMSHSAERERGPLKLLTRLKTLLNTGSSCFYDSGALTNTARFTLLDSN